MHTGGYELFRQVNKMTREEAIQVLRHIIQVADTSDCGIKEIDGIDEEALEMAIKELEQEPCNDAISRQAVLDNLSELNAISFYEAQEDSKEAYYEIRRLIKNMTPVNPQEKIGHCKDCKWWKDSDGVFRRGIGAESQCPMNRTEVYEGNGYCYMFDPQKRNDAK